MTTSPRCRRRSAVAGLLALVLGMVLVPDARAHAQIVDGLRISSETTYRVDPEVPAVFTEATYRMTNVQPDRNLGGGRIEFYFFEGAIIPVDPGAEFVEVRVDGREARFEMVEEDGFAYLDVSFGFRLRYDRTARVEVSWLIVGEPPRTSDEFSRVNEAYAAFPVFAFADEGRADVRVETPRGWSVDWVGSDLERSIDGGLDVYSAEDIESPLDFFTVFTARNDDALVSSDLDVGGSSFEIQSWPDDPAWLDFAIEHISEGLPVLEEIVGSPWPNDRVTEVTEASTPYLRGYAGFYDSSLDRIEVGEDLDSAVMLHELAHGWFNGTTIDSRWLSEGLSELVAVRALERLDLETGEPVPVDDVSEIETEAFQLSRWDTLPISDGSDAREAHGYLESYRVMEELRNEIGDERLLEVLAAVVDGTRPYNDEEGSLRVTRPLDWRTFLDLAEQEGGAEQWADVLVESVLIGSEAGELERRDDAVEAYEELLERSDDWFAPFDLRADLAAWRLTDAIEEIDAAHTVLDARDDLRSTLDGIALEPAPDLEDRYESRGVDLAELASDVDDRNESAQRLVERRSELADVLSEIGQDLPELDQATYEADPIGAADTAAVQAGDATALADALDQLDEAAGREQLDVPSLPPDAFADDASSARDDVLAWADTADSVGAAVERRDRADSFLERIGAIGSSVDDDLRAARAALADGDTTTAERLATESVLPEVDRLADRGRTRAIIGAIVAGTLLTLLVVAAARRRRGRDDQAEDLGNPVDLPRPVEVAAELSVDESADGAERSESVTDG